VQFGKVGESSPEIVQGKRPFRMPRQLDALPGGQV
jgi:hypothetical protein